MSRIQRRANLPVPFSNDDILLLFRTEIVNPLMKEDEASDLNKKCNELKLELGKMINDKLGNINASKGKPVSSKYIHKKTKLFLGDRQLDPLLDKQLVQLLQFKPFSFGNKSQLKLSRNPSKASKLVSSRSTKHNNNLGHTPNSSNTKSKKSHFSLNIVTDNYETGTKKRNPFHESKTSFFTSKPTRESNRLYSGSPYQDYPIQLTRDNRLFSKPGTAKAKSTYINYIQSKSCKKGVDEMQSIDYYLSDNRDSQFNSISNPSCKDVMKHHQRNQSSLFNTTLSTNHGAYHTRTLTNTHKAIPISKLKELLSEATNQLVPKLCKMKKRRFNSEPIKFYQSLDEKDKEKDLETLLDIKISPRDTKVIVKALNANLSNKIEVDYRQAVVRFAHKIGKVNPETAYNCANRIRDDYFEKTRTGKFKDALQSQLVHKKRMKNARIRIKRNHSKLTTLLANLRREKDKIL